MKDDAVPRFGKGVRLRRDPNGAAILLVPESALELNESAAAALELIDGERRFNEIVAAITEQFDIDRAAARDDIGSLFARLSERGFICG
ncbi:MAG TPA: pyrroloquinoline quinone biosynthesis peptide chaperone PqqD [Candidatus Cybelea sp.]